MRAVGKRLNLSDQCGDTIVEVMIVLAILGLAIGISYSTASSSLLQTRAAQENSKATELVQSQIESLRSLSAIAAGQPNDIYLPTDLFCIDGANDVKKFSPGSTVLTDYMIYPLECVQDSLYRLSVKYDKLDGGVQVDNFTVTSISDNVQGRGVDTVTLTYRIHRP